LRRRSQNADHKKHVAPDSKVPTRGQIFADSTAPIATAGVIFDDGTAIELVEDQSQPQHLSLLKFDGNIAEVSAQVSHRGQVYVPLKLDPSVRHALRLPQNYSPCGSTSELFGELVTLFAKVCDLAEDFRQLLAPSFLRLGAQT